MKKNNYPNKGFTLIEVLISIVILSLIAVITSNFLKSSIQSRDFISVKSQEIYEFNLVSSTLNEDLINAVNIPLTNFRGDLENATFIGDANSDSFSFITKMIVQDISSKTLVKVQYVLENQSLLRRQYFAAKTKWYYAWPQGPITQKQIPSLVKILITNNQNESFAWIISPNIKTVYE